MQTLIIHYLALSTRFELVILHFLLIFARNYFFRPSTIPFDYPSIDRNTRIYLALQSRIDSHILGNIGRSTTCHYHQLFIISTCKSSVFFMISCEQMYNCHLVCNLLSYQIMTFRIKFAICCFVLVRSLRQESRGLVSQKISILNEKINKKSK